jgi:uncharacterized repeat protein (TIGR02543 family)
MGRGRLPRVLARGFGLLAAVLAAFAFTPRSGCAAAAHTEQTLHEFCAPSNCPDGAFPAAGLIMDQMGNLYGTTQDGGAHGHGTVFKLAPKRSGGWTETVLYSFCSRANSQGTCTDGDAPQAGLIIDGAGNLYGTTSQGGAGHLPNGVVFELTSKRSGEWTETVLYSFCSRGGGNCTDGNQPYASLTMDDAGNLYGTTSQGGAGIARSGVVFELTPNQSRTAWTETVLYDFCSRSHCVDGANPYAGLIMDQSGNFYGTTTDSDTGGGVVFELTPNNQTGGWSETALYDLCSQSHCADGANPYAALIMDKSGNLYGTTSQGGSAGGGVVFKLAPQQGGGWNEMVLYDFCSQSGCADGANPFHASVIMDASGDLYGTTSAGGLAATGSPDGGGVAFGLTPNQTGGWTETVLYDFCLQSDCTDGEFPAAGLIMGKGGNLYGTTSFGGKTGICSTNGCGTAFVLFAPVSLSVVDEGNGSGSVTSFPAGIDCGPTCSAKFSSRTEVRLTASAARGSTFSGWSGNSACSGTETCTLTMDKKQSVTATFSAVTFPLAVSVVGSPGGTVASKPSGIDCGKTCIANFKSGVQVTLTATPAPGFVFAGWSDNGECSGTGACTLTMNKNQSLTANFSTVTFSLSVSVVGSPGGAVASEPPGIDCGGSCSAQFGSGVQVTLTATPARGYVFAGWTGNTSCSGIGTCTLTMNQNQSVTANFSTVTFSLSVSVVGSSGGGAVASEPPGIDCGLTCGAKFGSGTQVTLTATPARGYVFAGWTGSTSCSGIGTCQLTMNEDQAVTATFVSTN